MVPVFLFKDSVAFLLPSYVSLLENPGADIHAPAA